MKIYTTFDKRNRCFFGPLFLQARSLKGKSQWLVLGAMVWLAAVPAAYVDCFETQPPTN